MLVPPARSGANRTASRAKGDGGLEHSCSSPLMARWAVAGLCAERASRAEGGRRSAIVLRDRRFQGFLRHDRTPASHPTLGAVSALTELNWGQPSTGASFLTTAHGEWCDDDHILVTGGGRAEFESKAPPTRA